MQSMAEENYLITKNKKIEAPYNTHDYGLVFRSSGIFYFIKNGKVTTTISILNYWKLKRNIDVTIIASTRKLNGELVKREALNFQQGNVINYSPNIEEPFEGSIEIEALSIKNIVIPYIGNIVVYQSKYGISMVHSYGRAYSSYEIEEKKIVDHAEESGCNTCKDSTDIESFAIFHNGNRECPEQIIQVSVLNHKGKRQETSFKLGKLNPYETVKIRLEDRFPNIIDFLDGQIGYTTYSFHLNKSAFPRMLTVNQKRDGGDLQVTHSFFNLSKHQTARLKEEKSGFMFIPRIKDTKEDLIIYPDCVIGEYEVNCKSGRTYNFNENKGVTIPIDHDEEIIKFTKLNDRTPVRIHAGIRISKQNDRVTSESCSGIEHEEVMPKHFFWGICASGSKLRSQIILQQYALNADDEMHTNPIIIKFYSSKNHECKEVSINVEELKNGLYVSDIFPQSEQFFGDELGWFTLYNQSSHSVAFSTLENEYGSIAIEHTM